MEHKGYVHMQEKVMRVGCLLLAAGLSERYGAGNKLLTDIGGQPMISYPVRTLMAFADSCEAFDPMAVTRWPEVADICRKVGMPYVLYPGGLQSDSIRAGLAAASCREWDGCMFMAGDQPFLSAEALKKLTEAFFRQPDVICRLSWEGRPGNPVIFPAACFEALMGLKGDEGGRQLIRSGKWPVVLVEAPAASDLVDIDTRQDYGEVLQLMTKTPFED